MTASRGATRSRVLVFLKAPTPGTVKTRLAPTLGAVRAATLYRAMVGDLVERLAALSEIEIELRFAPAGARAAVRRWLGPRHRLAPQRGGDLGARMTDAFRRAFRDGCARCVIVGSDVPGLRATDVARALAKLARHDLVLGPSRDGGYYLVGLRQPRPELFVGMAWSTEGVFAETQRRARAMGLRVGRLRTLADIDEPADLVRLRRRMTPRAGVAPMAPRLAAWLAAEGTPRLRARSGAGRDREATPRRRERVSSSRRAAASR